MIGLSKYNGGKGHWGRLILPYLPLRSTYEWYIELFCGNAPFLMPKYHHYVDPSTTKVWLNDVNFDVFNVLRALKYDGPKFSADLLARINAANPSIIATKVEFERAKIDLRLDNAPDAYVFLRRLAINQIVQRRRRDLCSMSVKYSRKDISGSRNGLAPLTPTRIAEAVDVARQLQRITNWDFRRVLANLPPKPAVLYLDPPYWVNNPKSIYDDPFEESDYYDLRDLLAALDSARHRFLLSLEISELSTELFVVDGRFHWTRIPVVYVQAGQDGRREWEYLIANYPLVRSKALDNGAQTPTAA